MKILKSTFDINWPLQRSARKYRGVRTTSPHQFLANALTLLNTIRLHYVLITVTVFVLQIFPAFVPDWKRDTGTGRDMGTVPHQLNPITIMRWGVILSPLHRLVPSKFSTFPHPCTIQHNSEKKYAKKKSVCRIFFIT